MSVRSMGWRLVSGAFVVLLLMVPSMLPAADKLSPSLSELFDASEYKEAFCGCLVIDLDSGNTIYELNGDKLFAPASTTKLYSCAAALDALGANYRFETPLCHRGEIDLSGRLKGDLILVASGDPTLGGRTTSDGKIAFVNNDHTYANDSAKGELTLVDPLQGLNELAQKVAAVGITQVRGDVLIDDRLFDFATASGSGPIRVTPIVVNDNVLDIVLTPTQSGQLAQLSWRPQTASIRVDSRVTTVAASEPLEIEVQAIGPRNLLVIGRIPEGHKPLLKICEVPDPASFARSLLIEALQRKGITVERSLWADNARERLPAHEEVAKLPRLTVLQSPPLSESIKLIFKVSHNLHASTLPLLVAAKNGKRTLGAGMSLQREFLLRAGVNADSISFGGGAGGSPADAVTPRATVQLLRHMANRPDAAAYRDGLPVLGVDGTLFDAVAADSPARGHVHAKTGTLFFENLLNNRYLVTSKALAGYMTTSQRKNLAFAVFVNNAHIQTEADTARVGRTLGRFCELVWEAN
ncbi:MAG: D-alanyl-D-alanine carboxypeptidase/D-alanyl-D-alanine-endopeptidase [Planctomycetota bacterium]